MSVFAVEIFFGKIDVGIKSIKMRFERFSYP